MPWKSLSDPESGLAVRPRVLAGPMLRKVTASEVTVWVALRIPCDVTLTVLDTVGMIGSGRTTAVGTNLHIVAVTAQPDSPMAALTEGKVYRYDLSFRFDEGTKSLAEATDNAPLSYAPYDKPSFCLPPADLNQLRIFHGSCRIPHGNGADALPILDGLIAQGAENPMARPHQLLLTGDQIYADDVGFAMSMMLQDAASVLLGWDEEVVCNVPTLSTRRRIGTIYPALRGDIVRNDAHFTSVDFKGQLIGLGEFFAMYLMVWSEVLWPPSSISLPTFREIKDYFNDRPIEGDRLGLGALGFVEGDQENIDKATKRTEDFRRKVNDVRRALANIPIYMIFDDHEITDDWNMTRDFCKGVYGSELGLRIVQNGLTAYAICQHWGNAPEQFRTPTGVPPGEKLLTLLSGVNSVATYDSASASIRSLLGIHDNHVLSRRPLNGLFHDTISLTYNYTVEGPSHQIVVTDTRTWRNYPRGDSDGGVLLPLAQLNEQIALAKPDTGDRILLVVLSTNAPPVQPIRTASRHPRLTKKLAGDPFPDLYESWEMSRNATDQLFRVISDRMPLVDGKRQGAALLLSGDVHTTFTSRLLFRGTTRYRDPLTRPQPVNMVFAQLVSSSLRKQTDKTEGMHDDGFDYAPTGAGWLVPTNKPELYLGWNLPLSTSKRIGKRKNGPGSSASFTPITITGPRSYSIWDMPFNMVEEFPHDWSYRLDYLLAVQEAALPASPPPIPPMPAGNSEADRQRAIDAFNVATSNYRKFLKANTTKREMVGVNNISEITFDWKFSDATQRFALHTSRWRSWMPPTDRFTTYVCSLNPDDSTYPELKPL